MNPATRITLALIIAIVAGTLTSVMLTGAMFDPILLAVFAVACSASALLPGTRNDAAANAGPAVAPPGDSDTASADRETGKVKWFNVSKGFGFIIKDDGEEIFVHFRSIRGSGRRGLRDGQRVSFVVAQSDKGPQAEDVSPES